MSAASKTGDEPAFPYSIHMEGFDRLSFPGLTKREWFAGQALANPAICTGDAPEYDLRAWFGGRGGITRDEIRSRQAVNAATALIAQLDKAKP